MRSNVYYLVFDGLADWEAAYALCAVARSAKHRVVTIGLSKEPVVTMGGLKVIPDSSLADVEPAKAAFFILPGGGMWEETPDIGLTSGLRDLLRQLHTAGVPIGALCGATLEVARAGLTGHARHTSNARDYLKGMVPAYEDEMLYVDAPAVSDNRILTASALGSLEFGREVMKELALLDDAEIEGWYQMFKHGAVPTGPEVVV